MPPKNNQNKQKAPKKQPISWEQDGVDGGDSSITIILDWLGTGKNYLQWRGDVEGGITKTRLCSEILQIMQEHGITHRDSKGIRQKLGDLQASYNAACDWKKNTGQGILARDEINGVRTVQAKVLEICRHWDSLDPIMSSRSVTEPLHVRSSLTGDQLRGQQSSGHQPSGHPPSDESADAPAHEPTSGAITSDLPENPLDGLDSIATPAATKKKNSKKRGSTAGSSRSKANAKRPKKKKITTEELYMKSMVSKRQADVTRARAEASKVKVSYMKELCSHGLSLEEIEKKVAKEFPRLADMENPDDSSSSSSNSDDSSE
ncbi:hypothetical protein PCASD_06959 [Puccinia coronata f. sp. avenae]|uniref:Uncharacterized protein n=1 Tax=Puccinia coronata f. sp. avenae TaxID=200324 RepID=A0A2N5V4S9_9BASI|nr:hypothetical protein PCASD_06959 [Puccinia coronata f. sp. avenae]